MEAPLAASAGRRAVVVRAWYALAVGGLAVLGLHTIVGFGGPAVNHFFNQTLYNVIVLLAVAGCVLRVVWFRADRAAWLALTVAVAMWATGELLFDFAYGGTPPFPSLADVFYLGFAPAC